TLSTKVADVLVPTHAHAREHLGRQEQFRLYADAVSVTWLLSVPLAIALGAFASPLLDLWLRTPSAGSATILTVLALVLLLQMPGYNALVMLQGGERLGRLTKVISVGAAVNVAASIALTLSIGSLGPALGSLIGVVLVDCVYLPLVVCQELGRPRRLYWSEILRPSLAPTFLTLAVAAAWLSLDPSGVLVLLAAASLVVPYWGGWWRWCATERQKAYLRTALRTARAKRATR
ncbi:MAG: polysaccharide biosynthesis protein, partial [Pseudorhodobacter sp.]|nr:polysaccharide biosynthesis protein [Frankiaceae bacterium]